MRILILIISLLLIGCSDTEEPTAIQQQVEYALGEMYGIVRNYTKALAWYQKAAEQGHVKAQVKLGLMYDKGIGVPKDEHQAVKWYLKATEQGHESAKSLLFRVAIKSFNKQAVDWLHKTAKQGDATAQSLLGFVYESLWKKYRQGGSEGVSQDIVTAYMWINIATANELEMAADVREEISQEMTKEQIAEAEERSQKCLDSNYQDCDY